MTNEEFMCKCRLCGISYQMGRHKYDGKHLSRYKLDVCMTCYQSNWDGWSPQYEPKILLHAEKEGLELPKRNENGLLPRE